MSPYNPRGTGLFPEPTSWNGDPPADGDDRAECDCCGKARVLTRCWLGPLETFACDECRGVEPDDESD